LAAGRSASPSQAVWVAIDDPNETVRINSSSLSAPPHRWRARRRASRPSMTSPGSRPWPHRPATEVVRSASSSAVRLASAIWRWLPPLRPRRSPVLRALQPAAHDQRRAAGPPSYRRCQWASSSPIWLLPCFAVQRQWASLSFRLRRGIHYSNGDLVKPSDSVRGQTPVREPAGVLRHELPHRHRRRGRLHQPPSTCSAALAAGIVPDDHANTLTIHLVQPGLRRAVRTGDHLR
jgi:hypothetical protein